MEAKDVSSSLHPRLVWGGFLLGLLLATTAVAQNDAPPPAPPAPNKLPDAKAKVPAVPAEKQAAPKAPAVPAEKQAAPKAPAVPGEKLPPPRTLAPGAMPYVLPAPSLEPGEEGMPISLPAALRLGNAQAWDIVIATQQLGIAAAELQAARVLWMPNLQVGGYYQTHTGPSLDADGSIVSANQNGLAGGLSPVAIFAATDAIFTPLAARQDVRAQTANIQTSRNDTLTNMAEVYYDLLEAEADLAGILDVDQRAAKLVAKAVELAPGLIPDVEVARVRTAKHNFEQVVETARQRWRDASAEVARVTRLKPTVVLQPLEPPQLRITLVPLTLRPDDLIPLALNNRPELTFEQALAEAARQRLRQERWRPLLPTLLARGGGAPYPPQYVAVGVFSGGNSSLDPRTDFTVGAYWELRNLGFGNRALIRQRQSEFDVSRSKLYRFQDVVAKEVTQAWNDVRSAERRVESVGRELQQADISARLNLEGLGEVKRVAGGINILVIRPLEVVAALQSLESAYFDYFGVMADNNRAQFRLYRAIGNPAQLLAGHKGLGGPLLPPDAAAKPPVAPVPANRPNP